MRSKAPKEKRNETMTLSDRKYFATMIRSGAKYKDKINIKLIFKNFEKNLKTGQCLDGQCFADDCIESYKNWSTTA